MRVFPECLEELNLEISLIYDPIVHVKLVFIDLRTLELQKPFSEKAREVIKWPEIKQTILIVKLLEIVLAELLHR